MAPRMHGGPLLASTADVNGVVRIGAGTRNPFEPSAHRTLRALDYTARAAHLPTAALVRAGESLHYVCWHDNGAMRVFRVRGGVAAPPGRARGCLAADRRSRARRGRRLGRLSRSRADFPGRSFTGACVPANLVAGPTPDDEACALTGVAFDAADGQCDVSALPPLE
jgi:hypothetical protein